MTCKATANPKKHISEIDLIWDQEIEQRKCQMIKTLKKNQLKLTNMKRKTFQRNQSSKELSFTMILVHSKSILWLFCFWAHWIFYFLCCSCKLINFKISRQYTFQSQCLCSFWWVYLETYQLLESSKSLKSTNSHCSAEPLDLKHLWSISEWLWSQSHSSYILVLSLYSMFIFTALN